VINPSNHWTDKERRDTILEILNEIDPQDGRPVNFDREKVADVGQRIRFLASQSAEFLEVNREAILNGQK